MSWRDKCAVVGVWNHPEAAFLTYLGLYALQHRGQEGAGIVSLDKGKHLSHRDRGLVGQIFSRERLDQLKGTAAIGHTRYSTTGTDELKNIQPLTREMPFGPLAISHNGNIVNHRILKKQLAKKKYIFQDGESDTECLFPLISEEEEEDMGKSLQKSLQKVEGAFSLAFLTNKALIAARDPMGFRPLVLGKKEEAFIVASETCAFDLIGATYIREIEPGEVLVIDSEGMHSFHLPKAKRKALCVFEYVYFSRPDSFVFEQSVYERRKLMGVLLAKEHPVEADMVIPVPDSGVPAAIGYAKESGLPFEMGIIKKSLYRKNFYSSLSSGAQLQSENQTQSSESFNQGEKSGGGG